MRYRSHLFDCDGVLLQTNASKSRAFYEAALRYGRENAEALVAYHKQAGSIGRRARLVYFFDNILRRQPESGEIDSLMLRVTELVLEGAAKASTTPGIERYLEQLLNSGALTYVVSGIEQKELQHLLASHGLDGYFQEQRVFGSPPTKADLMARLAKEIWIPGMFYGDAEEDYRVAVQANLDFVLVTSDSEWFHGPDTVREDKNSFIISTFRELVSVGATR